MGDSGITEQVLRLLLAIAAGMALGLEREWREKAAGFRTISLVSLGAAIFLLLTDYIAPEEPARVIAGVVTGIGFLGAGAILRDRGQVVGLTTAATVWVAAGLGMAAAVGAYAIVALGVVSGIVVLLLFPLVDLTALSRDTRRYTIDYGRSAWDEEALGDRLRQAGLSASPVMVSSSADGLEVTWQVIGRPERHNVLMRALSDDSSIVSIKVTV